MLSVGVVLPRGVTCWPRKTALPGHLGVRIALGGFRESIRCRARHCLRHLVAICPIFRHKCEIIAPKLQIFSLFDPEMNQRARFHSAPEHPELRPGEVHLWRAKLSEVPQTLHATLSDDELARGHRFHFERDRQRHFAAHSLLRTILASYLGVEPQELVFEKNEHGKPAICKPACSLRFNLSHSDDLMLLVVTHAREVGVDIEALRENVPFEALAEHYFEPSDALHIRMLPTAEKAWFFYDVWTSLEARLKAAGTGLTDPPRVIDPDRWSLLTLTPADGYAAAVAVEGHRFGLSCWSWPS